MLNKDEIIKKMGKPTPLKIGLQKKWSASDFVDIHELKSKGYSTKQIAEALNIKTTYVSTILNKVKTAILIGKELQKRGFLGED